MRYICHNCKTEHGTDNMVAYCASCVSEMQKEIKRLRQIVDDSDCAECYLAGAGMRKLYAATWKKYLSINLLDFEAWLCEKARGK